MASLFVIPTKVGISVEATRVSGLIPTFVGMTGYGVSESAHG